MSNEAVTEGIDYASLTKVQKLALFLVGVGSERSAIILNHFDTDQIERVCKEIANFPVIDEDTQKKVRDEFTLVIDQGRDLIHGGRGFIQKALEEAQGNKRAAITMSHIIPDASYDEPFMDELASMDVRTIHNCISEEQPQTIAFVIARLSTVKAVTFLKMLPTEIREKVLERMGTMDATPLDYAKRIVETLKRQVAEEEQIIQPAGGVKTVADILNALPKDMSKDLLMKIEEKNEVLGKAVRRKMFSFDDLVRLEVADLQRIMREVETSDLVIAMKPASAKLQQAIFSSVSKRAAETLKEEIQMLGAQKVKDIEAAQDRIIQTVRRLEDQGEISLEAK